MRETERRAPRDDAGAWTELNAFLEAEEKRRTQEAAEALKHRRRQLIQGIKDQVVGRWSSPSYTIPAEIRARALMEIERELAARAVEELAEWELVALAEGIRDTHFRPVMEAQDEAKRLEERRRREEQEQQQTRLRENADRAERQREEARRAAEQRASQEQAQQQEEERVAALFEHGTDFASYALQEVDDLDPRDRQSILRRVEEELEAELTGKESERAVEARVDEILAEELGEAENGDEDDEDDNDDEDDDPYDEDDAHKGDEDEE
jgi:predicted ATP-dependent protease